MEEYIITVPENLVFEHTIDFIRTFKNLDSYKKFTFDFSNQRRIDPISLLLLSSEINLFRDKHENSQFTAKNYQHCTYPAHMGFFQSFGVNFGKFPGEANNTNRYIPIKIY